MFREWLRKYWQVSEVTGVTIDGAAAFIVPPPSEPEKLVRGLRVLLPAESVVALENTTFDPEVKSSLAKYAVNAGLRIRPGVIWPRSDWLHFVATSEALQTFEHLLRTVETPVVCIHLYAYVGADLLLQWHDAFNRDPILVSRHLPPQAVARFCSELGVAVPKSILNEQLQDKTDPD